MQLFNEEIKKLLKIPNLYAQDKAGDKAWVRCKFFDIGSNWTWYVTEAERQEDGDYLFFGLVSGFEVELGYFTLSELQAVNANFPRIERDLHFTPIMLGPLKREVREQRGRI